MTRARRFEELPLWTNLVVLFPMFVWGAAYDSFHEPKWLLLSMAVGGALLVATFVRRDLFRLRTPLDLPILAGLAATALAWRWEAPDRWVALVFWVRLGMMALLFRMWVARFSEPEDSQTVRSPSFDLALAAAVGGGMVLKEWALAPQAWAPGQVWSLLLLFTLLLRWSLEHFVLVGAYADREGVHRILDSFLVGGMGVALLAILQDWGIARWSGQPVSDWRFHLSSTLGNPNEVGGFLSYLIPAVLYRFWTAMHPWHRMFWGGVGLVYLYALTTVFTVGAWLGLFVVLPVSALLFDRFGLAGEGIRKRTGVFALLSLGLFLLLQGTLRVSMEGGVRTGLLLGGGTLLLGAAWWGFREFAPEKRRLGILALAGLLAVWGLLLPPWGMPNHPRGLVEEAVSSPRWKGGFGARRFIWKTTGLMVKDHPIRGIGWGHYYFLHAAYQGALYESTDKPHDRPNVGLVPQVHSDPLQVLAESGPLGSIAFLWLGLAAFALGLMARARDEIPDGVGLRWAVWAGLGLIAFHSAVDFPLRQPQPALLAVFFLAILASLARSPREVRPGSVSRVAILVPLALLFGGLGYWGILSHGALKSGFETSMQSFGMPDSDLRRDRLARSARILEGIAYPLPETHDRLIYLARIRLALGDVEGAKAALVEAGNHRHSQALYQAWREVGQQTRSPRLVLDSVLGLIRYNPNWAGGHRDAADLWRLLGEEEKAAEAEERAERFRVVD